MEMSLPFAVRLLGSVPFLRRYAARLIGVGFRPEHVNAPLRVKGPPTTGLLKFSRRFATIGAIGKDRASC